MKHQTCAAEYTHKQAGASTIPLRYKDSEVFDAWPAVSYSGLGFGGAFFFFYILDTKHQEFYLQKNSHHELK